MRKAVSSIASVYTNLRNCEGGKIDIKVYNFVSNNGYGFFLKKTYLFDHLRRRVCDLHLADLEKKKSKAIIEL